MTHFKTSVSLLLVVSIYGAGCATPGRDTKIGAGAGAGLGAIVGGATGGFKGALLGGAIGAAAGGAAGNLLDKQANELAQVANTKRTQDGILVKLKDDLLFDTGSSVLKPEAVAQLSQLGEIITKYPDDQIRLEGYTDNVGALAINEELSQKRAEAVKNVLADHGVSTKQMTAIGYGKTRPIAKNTTAQGRAQNRRVELHIANTAGSKSG